MEYPEKILTVSELTEMTLDEIKAYEAALWRAWRAAEKVKEYMEIVNREGA